MATSCRGSAVLLRAGRWLLALAVPACCCVLWMLLALAPLLPDDLAAGRRGSFTVSVGEIAATVGRWADDSPPATGSEEAVGTWTSPAPEREEMITDMPLPPPEREPIIDASPPPPPNPRTTPQVPQPLPPPPPEREPIVDGASSPPPEREPIIDASSPPPERRARTEPPPPSPPPPPAPAPTMAVAADPCAGRYIHILDLPSRFNADLLRDCRTLSRWTDMCKYVANTGMGPPLTTTTTGGDSDSVLPPTGWYDTNQFTLEVIFHARMLQYGCLTRDPTLAAAVFVPYYAGLDVGRHLFGPFGNAARDALAEDLARWLRSNSSAAAWKRHGGRDHFLVAGRIAWDFRRAEGGEWGSRLLHLPEAANMTALVLETTGDWAGAGDVAVPYPTSFHPSHDDDEVSSWQDSVRRARRPWLFAFAGAPRAGGGDAGALRAALMHQCARSPRCELMQCYGGGGARNDCSSPGNVMRLFTSADFCLQPPGDSYTRRSAFDAVLAGCVPVFFHPMSAYEQYAWHLPADRASYSVFVPEDAVRNGSVRVEDVLRRFGTAQVAAMREQVVRLIPNIVYKDPRAAPGGFRDAVDIAVDGVLERVARIKAGLPPREE